MEPEGDYPDNEDDAKNGFEVCGKRMVFFRVACGRVFCRKVTMGEKSPRSGGGASNHMYMCLVWGLASELIPPSLFAAQATVTL